MLSTVFALTALLVASASSSPIVVSRQLASAGWAYKGCFTEATGQRALVGKAYFDDLMTHEKCAAACSQFTYFGVEYGRECWCSSTGLNEGSVAVSENDCSFKCPGNPSQICGAGDRLTVYSKGSATSPVPTPTPSTYTAVGCYTDGEHGRALAEANYYDDALTVEKCAELCTPYLYYGLEYGRECRCGNVLHNSVAVAAEECNFPCAGNTAQLCGAGYRMNLYSLDGSIPGGSSSSSSTVGSSSTSSSGSSASSTDILTVSSSSSSETMTASSTEVSTTERLTSTVLSTSESSSTFSSTTTETPTLSSTTISTTEIPSTTSTTTSTTTTTTTTTTSTVPIETCLITNPVRNSGFELGSGTLATSWIPWSADVVGSFNDVDSGVSAPHSGLRSYRIRVPISSGVNRNSFRQTFPLGARPCVGRIYKYEAWVKLGAGFPASGVTVYVGPPSGPWTYRPVTSYEWQKIEGYSTIPNSASGPVLSVEWSFPPSTRINEVFFDDINMSLTPIGMVLPPV